jgi:hypothetical protein
MAYQEHESQKEHQNVEIDGAISVGQRQSPERHHPHGAEQRRSRPIEMKPADALDCNEEVGGEKDEQRRMHKQREQ